jgi:serine protease Do
MPEFGKLYRNVVFVLTLVLLLPTAAMAQAANRDALAALQATQQGFRNIHDQVMPAVVSITSRVEVEQPLDPFDFFFGRRPRTSIRQAAGSGVIIRPEGIVLTNSHVVQDATKVTVQLSGSEKTLDAEVVQTDPRTDLAVVRILEQGVYPAVQLGDAEQVQVGDWAIAFGSPFRLPSTMTVGIISAKRPQLTNPSGEYTYRDLLQTDASINPGNSGGPLVNIRGEVVGINFMILSPGESAGSVGIGFAIPINEYTKRIIDTLASGQAFERGRLGVSIKNPDPAIREQFGVPEGGVFVDHVLPGQAADKAGIKAEDIIIRFNDTPITDADQFVRLVEQTKPGTRITLTVVRDKKELQIPVNVGAAETVARATPTELERNVGMKVATVTPELAGQYRLPISHGVVVLNVQQMSPAQETGIAAGDVILRVGQTDVNSEEDFWNVLGKEMVASKYGVLLRVQRGKYATTLTLDPLEEK